MFVCAGASVCLRVYAPRIVFMDKSLCFTNTLIIVIKRQEKRPQVLVDIPNCLQAKPMKSGT